VTGPLSFFDDRPVQGEEDLLDTFRSGLRSPTSWGVGLEYERLGLFRADATAIPYSGDRGVERILREMTERFGWEAETESSRIVGLRRGGSRVALEPGGQIELSGGVHFSLAAVKEELSTHLAETSALFAPLGIAGVPIGLQPITPVEAIEWVPKGRYGIMAPHLAARGRLAHHMMKGTAGVQLNFDYSDESDAGTKLRTAMGITSIVTAACANSPLYLGALTGSLTRRAAIWLQTDPDRCGLLEFLLSEAFTFRDYLRYALDVPVIFVVRSGRHLPMDGITFRAFLRDGHQGLTASVADWIAHLTTIFTEVRLKSYMEVRGMDSVPPDLVMALAALWKGILYDPAACRGAWDLVAGASMAERIAFHRDVCVRGPEARLRDVKARDLALVLVWLAREGLGRLAEKRVAGSKPSAAGEIPSGESAPPASVAPADPDEAAYLDPLERSLRGEGGCPAARLARAWEAAGDGGPSVLINQAVREEAEFLGAEASPQGSSRSRLATEQSPPVTRNAKKRPAPRRPRRDRSST